MAANRGSVTRRIVGRLVLYTLRLNKLVFFSNRLRMYVYRKIVGMPIGQDTIIWAGNVFNDAQKFSVGDNCIIGPKNVFLIRGGLQIGNNVNLSGFSFFISQGHDVNDPNMSTKLAPIRIDDDSWVATNATILPGVHIGQGAVVAAGSVVTKDVHPFTVVAGNPARMIKERRRNFQYKLNDTKGMKWL